MGKGLHKFIKSAVIELNNALPNLVESGSEVSNIIPETSNFEEVTRLISDFKKAWLKATLKD